MVTGAGTVHPFVRRVEPRTFRGGTKRFGRYELALEEVLRN